MIPLISPERQNGPLIPTLQASVRRLAETAGGLWDPAPVEHLEQQLTALSGFRYAVACSSGTDAKVLALKALHLPAGSEVVVPALAPRSVPNAVCWAGLRPVFGDVDPETGCLTDEGVRAVLTPHTRAVIAFDLYGRQSLTAALKQFCHRQGLYVLEDASSAPGVPRRDVDFQILSFHPRRPLGAWGNAGALLTDDPEWATRLRELRNQGTLLRSHGTRPGTNAWMDPLQAVVLSAKLPKLTLWANLRQSLAYWYLRNLKAWELRRALRLPPLPPQDPQHVWSRFVIQVPAPRRESIRDFLRSRGIETGTAEVPLLPGLPAYREAVRGSYPLADSFHQQALALPLFAELAGKELEAVVKGLESCLKPDITSSFINR